MGVERAHTGRMSHELTVVRHCGSLQEAEFYRSLLESEGVDVQIPDEFALGANPGLTNAFGGVRLLVGSDDLTLAEAVLAATDTAASR